MCSGAKVALLDPVEIRAGKGEKEYGTVPFHGPFAPALFRASRVLFASEDHVRLTLAPGAHLYELLLDVDVLPPT